MCLWWIVIVVIIVISGGSGYYAGRYMHHRPRMNQAPPLSPELSEWDIQCIAYHEAGHAVCARFLPEVEPITRITIDPSDVAFGFVACRPREHHNATDVYFHSQVAMLLAGRLAEQMFLKCTTTSCVHDLKSASNIAAMMVCEYGMGKRVGLNSSENIPLLFPDAFCADVQEIIADSKMLAENILKEHHDLVVKLAHLLLRERTLDETAANDFFDKYFRRLNE